MIKLRVYILALLGMLFSMKPVSSQFLNIDITIQPEVSVRVLQHLDFGVLTANSGTHRISADDVHAGIFEINAYQTQNIFLSLDMPEYLEAVSRPSSTAIPLSLQAAYGYNRHYRNTDAVTPLPGGSYTRLIQDSAAPPSKSDNAVRDIFIYVYGELTIGDVESGEYAGAAVLTVDFN